MVIGVYLLSFALALALLVCVHSHPWYLHVLAIAAAVALGFYQRPPEWNSLGWDLTFGGAITFLLVWGIGGLLPTGRHRMRHA
jgi:hypothetical protein